MNQRPSLNGYFFAGGSSRRVDARLHALSDCLELRDHLDGYLGSYKVGEFQISDPIGNLPYRFSFNDGSSFETSDHSSVEALFRSSSRGFRWTIHAMEQKLRWALAFMVLLPVMVWALSVYGLPVAANVLSKELPPGLLAAIDNKVIEQMDSTRLFDQSDANSHATERLQDSLREVLQDAEISFQPDHISLLMRSSKSLGANAFALPGGHIVVTDQLLTKVTSDHQLMAILAHEVGHVEYRHGMRNLIQAVGISALFATVVGDVSVVAETLLVTAPTLLQQFHYSREFEREADRYAIATLRQMNIPGSCLGAALDTLITSHRQAEKRAQKEEKEQPTKDDGKRRLPDFDWPDYLSTHPGMSERIGAAGGTDC